MSTFERNALYEEVWSQPMTSLAAKYNLSDNGLRKICKAMNIPMPSAGHWAKVAVGKAPPRTPLPENASQTSYTRQPPIESLRFSRPEDAVWLAERLEFEQQEGSRIEVEAPPKRWHPVVVPLRDALREAAKEVEGWRRDFERGEKTPRLRQLPGYRGGHWPYFVDKGQILLETHRSTPLRLTLLHFERGLSILNAICLNAEKRGFRVSMDDGEGRVVLEGHGGSVPLRMTEKLIENHRQEINSWSKKPEQVRFHTPSGVLRVYVGATYSEKEISDQPDLPLERQLNSLFARVYRRVIRAREDQREREDSRRRADEAAKRREIEEVRRREEAKRQEAERKRRDALVSDAQNWATARLLRAYIEHVVTSNGPIEDARGREEWAEWARGVADSLDPTRPTL